MKNARRRLNASLRSVGLSLAACAALPAQAQDQAASEPQTQEASSAPAGKSGGGFFNRIGNGLTGALKGSSPDTTALASVAPGSYKPSNEAIGEERDVESKRVDALGLIPLPAFQAYANGLLDKLKAASGVTNVPGKVYVLASTGLDAGSTPDGNIFISVGWINSVESEDELVALLGHELGHVLLRHHDSTMISRLQKQGQGYFVVASDLGGQLMRAGQMSDTRMATAQQVTVKRTQILIELTDRAALPAWGRAQERDADRMAVDLVDKTGYSTRQAVGIFLERIRNWEEQQEAVKKKMQAELQESVQGMAQNGQLDAAMKKSLEGATNSILETVGEAHDRADKRIEDLAFYREKFYAASPRRAVRATEYQAVVDSKEVKPVLDAYDQVFKSVPAIAEKRYGDAVTLLTGVTGSGMAAASHAEPNYYLYLALDGEGKSTDAVRYLERSFNAVEPSWKPFEATARYYARQGDQTRAAETIDKAIVQFKGAPALQPQLVGIYTELGWRDKAQQALATCNLQHVAYRDACRERSKKK